MPFTSAGHVEELCQDRYDAGRRRDGLHTGRAVLQRPGLADRLRRYRLEALCAGRWQTLYEGHAPTTERVKIHRFPTVWGSQVRLTVLESRGTTSIAEVGVYCERR